MDFNEEIAQQFKEDFNLTSSEIGELVRLAEIPTFINYKRDDILDFSQSTHPYDEFIYIIESHGINVDSIIQKYDLRRQYIINELDTLYTNHKPLMDALVYNACIDLQKKSLVTLRKLHKEILDTIENNSEVSINKIPTTESKNFPEHLTTSDEIPFLVVIMNAFNSKKNLSIQLKDESKEIICKPIQFELSQNEQESSLLEVEVLNTPLFSKRKIIQVTDIESIECFNLYRKRIKVTREDALNNEALLGFIIYSIQSGNYYDSYEKIIKI